MKKLSLITTVLLTTLHPSSTFAMFPRATVKITRKMVGSPANFFGLGLSTLVYGTQEAALADKKWEGASRGFATSSTSTTLKTGSKENNYGIASFSTTTKDVFSSENIQVAPIQAQADAQPITQATIPATEAEIKTLHAESLLQAAQATEDGETALEQAKVATSKEEKMWWMGIASSYKSAVSSYQTASDSWLQAIEAISRGNQEIGAVWIKAAEQSQIAAVCYKRSQENFFNREIQSANGASRCFKNSAICLSKIEECLNTVSEARDNKNQELIDAWSIAIQKYKMGSDGYIKATLFFEEGKMGKAQNFEKIADVTQKAAAALAESAKYLPKLQKAKLSKSEESVNCWVDIIQKYQMAAQWYDVDAWFYSYEDQGYGQGCPWNTAVAYPLKKAADALVKRMEYLSKIKEASATENQELINCWAEIVEKYKTIAEELMKEAKLMKEGKSNNYTWRSIATSAECAAQLLEKKAEDLKNYELLPSS